MGESSTNDSREGLPDIPKEWVLFLVNAKMRVLACSLPKGQGERVDLAEYLAAQGIELAEVGELLACLEDLPADCELRLRLGQANMSVVARGVDKIPGVSCVVLRNRSGAAAEERSITSAWKWAGRQSVLLGLVSAVPGESPIRVMFVDENPEIVSYGKILGRKLGCRVEGAASGGEALATAKKQLIDLVVIDVRIPGMGPRVLSQLLRERCSRHWGRAPLVAIMAEEAMLRELNGDNHLEKPLAMDELSELVKRARIYRQHTGNGKADEEAVPVLRLELWEEDRPLLKRLSQALLAQASELTHRVRVEPGYARSDEFARELLSLKNGCDILHAKRLSAVCEALLDEIPDAPESVSRGLIEKLMIEIESFRLFALGNGLVGRD